jgi:Dehydrogenases with different specificities (related to short-chain alcohol dehydrogenases)
VKAYDMDVQTPTRALLLELSVNSERRMVIYRDGERYVEQFDYLDVVSTRYSGVKVVEGGNYLITGGTGAIGMEVAKYLAKQNNVNLILASRSGLPARDQWDSVLQVGGKTADKVRKIKELESMGSSVTVYASDCGDIPQLEALVHAVKENHGNINGIVHAAGNPGKNVISMRETKDFEEVIYPKIQGTFLLHQLTREMNTDFMILFSSVAAIFPTAGQGDYAAANTYMDTFADQFNGSGTRIVSMQWAAWRDIGMAVDYLTNQDTTFKAIPTQQGIDCIDKALEHIPSRVFVGEVNYPNEIVQWLQEVGIKLSDDIDQKISLVLNKDRNPIASSGANAEQESLTEVELQGRASGDYSKTEQAIGSIWAEALGYEELNIEDEFLDLGGESITAMTIARAITDVLDITVDVGSLMEHSTISSLAQFIDKQSIAA